MKKISVLISLVSGVAALAMPYETRKLIVWRHGEEIAGEEFIAANEAVVDYLATLPRPTGGLFEVNRFNCSVKMRMIRPSVTSNPMPTNNPSVLVTMIYDIKDCVAIAESPKP
ncbi:MAG: hypothetical protein HYR96_07240 [Deltaproteobacteria bacterium]|nr:hypothetical protein [Deltaproteobacteria bacterium]MBI3295135.1 hypothetical protein [Deltaproteobacteria bacterium]